MKTKLTLLIILLSIMGYAQSGINYKALIKDDLGNVVANDLIIVQFDILEGTAQTAVYSEFHQVTTDDNGLIVLVIGEGTLFAGSPNYDTIDWGNDSHFLETSINIGNGLITMGVTEFRTVPYALSSGDKSFESEIDNVHVLSKNVGIGTDSPTALLEITDNDEANIKLTVPNIGDQSALEFRNGNASGAHSFYKIENRSDILRFELDTDFNTTTSGFQEKMTLNNLGLKLENGARVNEFSTDITLSGNSNNAVPTEAAVKTYVDNAVGNQVIFKARGNGFAVKDIDGGTEVETDIWDIEVFDTANAFNTTTARFVAPSAGHYFLHACVRQSNSISSAFFRIRFNIDNFARYHTIVDGDDVKTEVSGIYFLTSGQEVYVLLRNYTAGVNESMDGTGSWFEGYKL
ncbi:hypothetical protein [Psychroserpens sp.]|uniref:hypothetical protein n=1 Tax=Psychroserpens sp. TaxID=2020870 RepID=UPI003C72ED52